MVKAEDIIKNNYNLDVGNPSKKAKFEHLPPEELITKIEESEKKISTLLGEIKKMI